MARLLALLAPVLAACATTGANSPPAPAVGSAAAAGGEYRVWVASESVDQITLVSFDGREATLVRNSPVGVMPVEIDGPHGIAAAPDGEHVYVSLGHGLRTGWLLKVDAGTGEVVGRTSLGLFPATVSVTPDGRYAFVSNFNLHGDHVPSSISKVEVGQMVEVARTETCVMPHGSRVNPLGNRHYSVCMMDDLLVEIDVETGEVRRELDLGAGPALDQAAGMPGAAADPVCSPTWAEPSTDGEAVFVACNRAAEILQVDVDGWEVVRRFPTGENPYNLAATPDGRYLLSTLRGRTDPALQVFDLETGARVAHVRTTTTLAHGIAVSADSRYAFVSVEGVGSEPGKIDIIDLSTMALLTSIEVGQQATGIATLD